MIKVTRLNGKEHYINPHLIEDIECNPDTTVTLVPNKIIIVRESAEELIDKIIVYRRKIGIAFADAEGNALAHNEERDA